MKRGVQALYIILLLMISLVIVIILITLFQFMKPSVIGKVIFTPSLTTDCSDASIKSVWDSMFYESSNGITIYTNNTLLDEGCKTYFAYKENGDESYFLLGGVYNMSFFNSDYKISFVYSFKIKGNEEVKNRVISNASKIVNSDEFENYLMFLVYDVNGSSNRQIPIINNTLANSEFISVFKIDSSEINQTNWDYESDFFNEFNLYEFENEDEVLIDENTTISKMVAGLVYENKTVNVFVYLKSTTKKLPCTSNWTYSYSICKSNEIKEVYYYDKNYCDFSLMKMEYNNEDCDFDNNHIIGNISNIRTENLNLKLKINNISFNQSLVYSNIQKVNIFDENESIVEFYWNFSTPLNFRNITVIKQDSSSNKGFIIIKGLSVNKTVQLDKMNNLSKSVCVGDKEVNSLSDIDQDCTGSNEFLVNCPGNNNAFSCNLSNNKFIVSGLRNSIIAEIILISDLDCETNWTCTNWSACPSTKTQSRTCTDSNSCGDITNIPTLSQACAPPCTPNWTCTEWNPTECPKNKTQNRTCSDLNNCEDDSGKLAETKPCTYVAKKKDSTWIFITIIIILLVMIVSVIVFIIKFFGGTSEINNAEHYPVASVD